MWKLSRRGGKTPRATGVAVAALVLFGALTLPATITLACDDDYRQPVGSTPYPQGGPTLVFVEPRDDSRYERRRERAQRRYWHWRAREHAREHRHHDRDRGWR